jgi:hypothetical protein
MSIPRCLDCGNETWNSDGRCSVCNSFPTLGYDVADWIQANCAIPDGDMTGEPFIPTDEQLRFLLHFYRINPLSERDERGRWRNAFWYSRGAQLVRPQKSGKGPLGAAIICAEAGSDSPPLFDGWNADGSPVGRPWPTPWIQVTAVSQDQTDNVYTVLKPMIELGALHADIKDTGLTRIFLPSGGRIEPVTSSATSRLGQRITHACQDETHSWIETNGGWKLADTQRRNLAGTGGRFCAYTNAWDPREMSVGQRTYEANDRGVYNDIVEPGRGSIRNKTERRRMLKKVYGDSWWVDLDRIEDEIEALLQHDPSQAERFFLNRIQAAEDTAFDWQRFAEECYQSEHELSKKTLVTIGVAGARFTNALAIIGTEVETGYQWPIGIWERPEYASEDYEHPFTEIDAAFKEAMKFFSVWRVYCNPFQIDHLVDGWAGKYGDKKIISWATNRPRQMAWAVRNYQTALASGDISHSEDKGSTFLTHIKNARKRKVAVVDERERQMYTISQDRPDSKNKIDAAVAAVLSWEARGDAIAAGAKRPVGIPLIAYAQ